MSGFTCVRVGRGCDVERGAIVLLVRVCGCEKENKRSVLLSSKEYYVCEFLSAEKSDFRSPVHFSTLHFHDFVASNLSATANLIFYRQSSILQQLCHTVHLFVGNGDERGFIPSCVDHSVNQMAAYITLLQCRLH